MKTLNNGKTLMLALVVAATVLGACPDLWADGMIVPTRREIRVSGHWAVNYHHVNITVRDQVASVSVDQEFVNTGSGMIEVEYLFPVPPDAAIDSMTLVVNGREFAAQLLKADEARRIYESIVRSKKDPALLEYVGYGLVKTSAFPLEPNKPAKVIVTYKQACKKDADLVEVWYPLSTEKFSARPIRDVTVNVDIKSKSDITAVYSPTHDLTVKRDKGDPCHVKVSYEAQETLPTSDFQVFYKEANEKVGATLLTHQPKADRDGYFMMLVTPNPRETSKQDALPKDVVVVFDHSGSMSGEKMTQAGDSVRYILKNLNPKDRFNVIGYSDSISVFFDGLVAVNDRNLEEALDRLDRVEARGGTNICDSLRDAMKLYDGKDRDRPAYIIFMTDGLPTIGETADASILKATREANRCGVRLFAFGVGYDVNVRLLDKLVQENNGKSDYAKPKESIETKITSLYAKIRNPVMTDLAIDIKGLKMMDPYPRKLGDLFDGDQIVLVGRYDCKGVDDLATDDEGNYRTQMLITGKYLGESMSFEYPVTVQKIGRNWRYEFVEKLWAIRRVGWLVDQIHLNGEKKEIIDELISLSRDYGIMTPYTAFLADERTPLAATPKAREERMRIWHKHDATEDLRRESGAGAQMAGEARQKLNQADRPQAPLAEAAAPGLAFDAEGRRSEQAKAKGGRVFGNADKKMYEGDKEETIGGKNMRLVSATGQPVYRRDANVWVAANAVDVDLEEDEITEIERYSEEYFRLTIENTRSENLILSQQAADEELVIRLRGNVYRVR